MSQFEKIDNASRIEGPHGWIQWKGTNVCADIHCACGYHSHIDAEFAYYVRCPNCGQNYAMGTYVMLVPLDPEDLDGHEDFIIADP